MSAEARTCSSCGYGVEVPLRLGAIECRAQPPTVIPTSQGLISAFPQLHGSMGCGHWVPKGVEVMAVHAEKPTEKPTEKAHGKT